jgi:hypothetical protein
METVLVAKTKLANRSTSVVSFSVYYTSWIFLEITKVDIT